MVDVGQLAQRLREIERAESEYVSPQVQLAREKTSLQAQLKSAQREEERKAITDATSQVSTIRQRNATAEAEFIAALDTFKQALPALMAPVVEAAQRLDASHAERNDLAARVINAAD